MIVTSALGHRFALLSQLEIHLDEMFVAPFNGLTLYGKHKVM
jgi:hypothetical protein